ncbi:MAG TPA: OB-fold domain-containing protein [Advenella sp.]|nr:OB-fold domain-containing protein [Advenella sp.]
MDNELVPDINDCNRPYWESLAHGSLTFQTCARCGHNWLPPSRCCPGCLSTSWSWSKAAGRGKIISWVVYHVAYHPAFKDRLPYNVALIELQEGPRLISNVLGDCALLSGNAEVDLVIETQGDVHVPRFVLAGNGG